MSNNPERPDLDQVKFFGRITASVTHELNNVMAVTNEVTGLLGDLIEDCRSNELPSPERLQKVYDRLLTQVERGGAIIKRLNRFAHTADRSPESFDLNEVMENLVGLARRMSDLKRVVLEFQPGDGKFTVLGYPFLLQQAVYESLGLILESGCAGKNLIVQTKMEEGRASVVVFGFDGGAGFPPRAEFAQVEEIMKKMHGGIIFPEGGANGYAELTFIASLPE